MPDRGEKVEKKASLRPLETFGIGRLITDNDFRVTEISEPSARLLGAEPEELLSRQLCSENGPKREILEEAARGRIHLSECRTSDGRSANFCFRVIKLNGGESEGYDVVFMKESENLKCSGGESAHFHEMIQELEYKQAQTAFLERLLESTGHDLKTPLGVVLGYCELLFKGKATQAATEQERIQKTIYRNCAWISEMVEKLEDFTSTIRRCREEKREAVNLAQSLRESAGKLCKTSFTTQVKLNVEGPETVTVSGAPSLFSLISDELLKNSILICREDREILVTVLEKGGRSIVITEIPALVDEAPSTGHLAERVFIHPPDFHKESAEIKAFCLGLGAVKYLVMMLGGSLTVTGRSREGARITVEFPSGGNS